MPGRLDQIETTLRGTLGSAFVMAHPAIVYNVDHILMRFWRTGESLPVLCRRLDSMLFNEVFDATASAMRLILDDGRVRLITSEMIADLADRLLAIAYAHKEPNAALQDALFDFAREGSFSAMRTLLARYPLDEGERAFIAQILAENNQLG